MQMPVTEGPNGLRAKSEPKGVEAWLEPSMVYVRIQRSFDPKRELELLLARGPSEVGALADGVGGVASLDKTIVRERDGAVFHMVFFFAAKPEADVAALAKKNGLVDDQGMWVKKARENNELSISVSAQPNAVEVIAATASSSNRPDCRAGQN